MKKIFLAFGFMLGLSAPAFAAATNINCIGVGGVNNVPQPGVACVMESNTPTYVASGIGMEPPSSATDLACISGAANYVMRVLSIRVTGTAATLVTTPIVIVKRAAVDTGGTKNTGAALPVAYPVDPSSPTSQATLVSYSAVPTINDTSPGYVDVQELTLPTTAAGTVGGQAFFNWSMERPVGELPILRTAAQQLCVNLNSVSISTGAVNASFKWTESSQ